MASSVELAPVPPITGSRPLARSTVNPMIFLCSSKSTVADSPVVPTETIPSVPLSTCHSTKPSRASQSTAPVGAIGVTSATRLPWIMDVLLEWLGTGPYSIAGPLPTTRRCKPEDWAAHPPSVLAALRAAASGRPLPNRPLRGLREGSVERIGREGRNRKSPGGSGDGSRGRDRDGHGGSLGLAEASQGWCSKAAQHGL